MPKQTFQITADIPEGYEPTCEFREPDIEQEPWLTIDGRVGDRWMNPCGPRIILRKKWTPPKCFREGSWVWESVDGVWYVSRDKTYPYGPQLPAVAFAELFGETFTPPTHTKLIQVKHA